MDLCNYLFSYRVSKFYEFRTSFCDIGEPNKKIDISSNRLYEIVNVFKPDTIFHLAAESHVDNSIKNSKVLVNSNIIGTSVLLEIVRNFWNKKNFIKKK